MTERKRVGVLTGGGDAPGLNAVIRAVVKSSDAFGFECIGLEDSFDGLIEPDRWRVLGMRDVVGIIRIGGTILGTTNWGDPFAYPVATSDGSRDYSKRCLEMFDTLGLHALIVIGGDGTLMIAERFHRLGMPIIGVPKTIDNDIVGTNSCFGFDTAVSFATDAIDRLHTTAESHRRVMVVEVMGRDAGWIALYAGLAGGADVILIPEIPFAFERVVERIRERDRGSVSVLQPASAGRPERLGGIGTLVAARLQQLTGKDTRSVVLGHLQRGGTPTAFDRVLATRFGGKAMELVQHKTFGMMVANRPPEIVAIPLAEIVGKTKRVPLDLDLVKTARSTGICFGD